jgi:hypothetical protein
MYSKKEIISMIARQFNTKQTVLDHIIERMIVLSDEIIVSEFTKSCGAKLQKIGSQFAISF